VERYAFAAVPTLLQTELADHGHRVLYLFPYASKANAIEMIWGITKPEVARMYRTGRTWQGTIDNWRHAAYVKFRLAFNGNGNDLAARTVRKCQEETTAEYVPLHDDLKLYGKIGAFVLPPAVQQEVAELWSLCPEEELAGTDGAVESGIVDDGAVRKEEECELFVL
jgi:hypothetical protein